MSDRRNDVLVVCGAVLVLCLLSSVGTSGVRLAPGTLIVGDDAAQRIAWLAWGFKILGKIPGHLACGLILGAFLKHTTPRRVLTWLIGILLILTSVTLYLPSLAGDYVKIVGLPGVLIQQAGIILSSAGFIFVGILIGEKIRARMVKQQQGLVEHAAPETK